MKTVRSNVDLVVDLMERSPRGALCQMFIIEAIRQYAESMAKLDPAEINPGGFVNPEAWIDIGKDITQRMKDFYASR